MSASRRSASSRFGDTPASRSIATRFGEPRLALATELERLAQPRDRGRSRTVLAVQRGQALVELRGDAAGQRVAGERGVERGPEPVVGLGRRRRDLEDRQQLVVERLADAGVADDRPRGVFPHAERRAEVRERVHGAAIGRLRGDDLLVGLGGVRGVVQLVGQDVGVGEAQSCGLALLALPARERGDRAVVRRRDLVPRAGRRAERHQLVLDQLVARRERERLGEVGERAGAVVLMVEPELGGLAQQRQPGAVVLGLGEPGGQQLEHAGDVAGRAHRLGERVGGGGARRRDVEQAGQARARGLARRVDRDRVAVRRERARRLAEVLAQRIAEADQPADRALGRAAWSCSSSRS